MRVCVCDGIRLDIDIQKGCKDHGSSIFATRFVASSQVSVDLDFYSSVKTPRSAK